MGFFYSPNSTGTIQASICYSQTLFSSCCNLAALMTHHHQRTDSPMLLKSFNEGSKTLLLLNMIPFQVERGKMRRSNLWKVPRWRERVSLKVKYGDWVCNWGNYIRGNWSRIGQGLFRGRMKYQFIKGIDAHCFFSNNIHQNCNNKKYKYVRNTKGYEILLTTVVFCSTNIFHQLFLTLSN